MISGLSLESRFARDLFRRREFTGSQPRSICVLCDIKSIGMPYVDIAPYFDAFLASGFPECGNSRSVCCIAPCVDTFVLVRLTLFFFIMRLI